MPDALQSSVSFIGRTPLLFVVVDVKAMHIFPRLRCRGMVGMMIPVCLANSDGMTSSLAMSYQRVLYPPQDFESRYLGLAQRRKTAVARAVVFLGMAQLKLDDAEGSKYKVDSP